MLSRSRCLFQSGSALARVICATLLLAQLACRHDVPPAPLSPKAVDANDDASRRELVLTHEQLVALARTTSDPYDKVGVMLDRRTDQGIVFQYASLDHTILDSFFFSCVTPDGTIERASSDPKRRPVYSTPQAPKDSKGR